MATGRAAAAEHVGIRQAAEPEGVEEHLLPVRPGEPAALGEAVQQVQPRPAPQHTTTSPRTLWR